MIDTGTRTQRQPRSTGTLGRPAIALAFLLALAPAWCVGARTVGAVPAAAPPDLKSLLLSTDDLPGYTIDPTRSSSLDGPDGAAYDVTYVRNPSGTGGVQEVRVAAARTTSGQDSARALVTSVDALVQVGWTIRGVPLLGDESVGLEMSAGGKAQFLYMFRFGRHVMGAGVSGTPNATPFDQALGYAVRMSQKLDQALAREPLDDPAPALAAAVVPAPSGPAVVPVPSGPIVVPTPSGPVVAASSGAVAEAAPVSVAVTAPSPTPAPSPTAAQSSAAAPPAGRDVALNGGTAASSAVPAPVAVPTIVADVNLDDSPDVGAGYRLGGFSGLYALDSSGTSFATLTDRGPNGEIQVSGTKQMAFPLPTFAPRMVTLRLDGEKLKVVESVLIRLPDGYKDPVSKSRDVTGLPIMDGGEAAYSTNGRDKLPLDPNGIDTEGIALDLRDGTFWLVEEYGPSILHVAADGTVLARLVPSGMGLDAPGENVRDILPGVLRRRKPNRGFEGVAITPDGSRVFAILQSPLSNPDKKVGEASRHIRIVAIDTTDPATPKLAGMYVYQTQSYGDVGASEQDDIKIGDLAAVSATTVLVAERDSEEGGAHKKVYAIDLSKATNIAGRDEFSGKTLEQTSESDMKKANVAYAPKTLVVDLARLGFRPDKFEGLALVNPTTLAVVNDNDFGVEGIDSKGKVTRSKSAARLVVIRLPTPVQ